MALVFPSSQSSHKRSYIKPWSPTLRSIRHTPRRRYASLRAFGLSLLRWPTAAQPTLSPCWHGGRVMTPSSWARIMWNTMSVRHCVFCDSGSSLAQKFVYTHYTHWIYLFICWSYPNGNSSNFLLFRLFHPSRHLVLDVHYWVKPTKPPGDELWRLGRFIFSYSLLLLVKFEQ